MHFSEMHGRDDKKGVVFRPLAAGYSNREAVSSSAIAKGCRQAGRRRPHGQRRRCRRRDGQGRNGRAAQLGRGQEDDAAVGQFSRRAGHRIPRKLGRGRRKPNSADSRETRTLSQQETALPRRASIGGPEGDLHGPRRLRSMVRQRLGAGRFQPTRGSRSHLQRADRERLPGGIENVPFAGRGGRRYRSAVPSAACFSRFSVDICYLFVVLT